MMFLFIYIFSFVFVFWFSFFRHFQINTFLLLTFSLPFLSFFCLSEIVEERKKRIERIFDAVEDLKINTTD